MAERKIIMVTFPAFGCIAHPAQHSLSKPTNPGFIRKGKTGKTPVGKTLFSRWEKQSFSSCLPFTGFPPLYPEAQGYEDGALDAAEDLSGMVF